MCIYIVTQIEALKQIRAARPPIVEKQPDGTHAVNCRCSGFLGTIVYQPLAGPGV